MELFGAILEDYKAMGINIEITEGEDLLPKARVKNDPVQVRVIETIMGDLSPEAADKIAKDEKNKIIKNTRNFAEGVDIYKNFQRVDIYKLFPCASNWGYFNEPNDSQFVTLTASIQQVGIIQPLVLLHNNDQDDKYDILVGYSRYLASKNLFESTNDERFRYVPAFILKREEVGEYFARILVLDSNFSYRTIDQTVLIRALIERYELLKRTKLYRSEANIALVLADEFLMSRSTVFNYLCLRKLCEEVMVLLLEKRIKLQSARYLSRVSHNMQRLILEKLGIENINVIHRVKYITSTEPSSEKKLEESIAIANELVPFQTTVKVTMNKDLVNEYMKMNAEFNEYAMRNYESKYRRNNSDYYFKVRYDKDHMRYYIEKEYLDEKILGRVSAKTFKELKNYK